MRGFTLIELVIVMAILLILFAVVGTISSGMLPRNQLSIEGGLIQETLRRAQALTIAGKQDELWGVHFTSSTMTLFGGTSYAMRDIDYDELHSFPAGLTLGGLTDIVFSAPLGETSNTGDVSLTSNSTSEIVTISVNASGLVSKE